MWRAQRQKRSAWSMVMKSRAGWALTAGWGRWRATSWRVVAARWIAVESLKLGTRNVAIDPESEADALLEPGRRTVDAVNHGIYMAAVSAINRIYSEVCDQQGVALPVLLTGGDARVVSRGVQVPHAVWPDMVYGGLEASFPLTFAERAGKMSGAPRVPEPVSLEKIRAGLAFSMLL